MICKRVRSVSQKMVVMVLAFIIPLNILLVFVSYRTIYNVKEDLAQTYRSELAVYVAKLDSEFEQAITTMEELIKESWPQLSQDEEQVDFARYNVWKELSRSRDALDFPVSAYLITHWDDCVSYTYDNLRQSYEEQKEVVAVLEKTDFWQYDLYSFSALNMGDNSYLVMNVNYSEYSFGFLIDVNDIIDDLSDQNIDISKENAYYLIDGEGMILNQSDVDSISVNLEENSWQYVNVGGEDMLAVAYQSSVTSLVLVHVFESDSISNAVPMFKRSTLLLAILSFVLIPIILYVVYRLVLKPISSFNFAMAEIENDNIGYQMEEKMNTSEFAHMQTVFNRMSGQIKTLRIDAYEMELEKMRMEAYNIKLQLNPHLLLNSLNMIYSLVQTNHAALAQKYILHLVEYFRYSLRETEQLVELKSEMRFIENFLEIQKVRFPNAFTNVYDIDENLEDVLIPPLIIENYVENIIKHGLKIGEEIEIIILVKKMDDGFSISICDTGCGIEPETLEKLNSGEIIENQSGKHIGIYNTRRRLQFYYNDNYELHITSSAGSGTQIWMKLPYLEK